MKDEIKEILDDLKKTADNTIFVVAVNQEELDRMPRYTANFLSINNRQAKLLLDYITNLQEENKRLKEINKINNDEDYIYTYEELQDKVLKLQKEYNDLSKKLWGEVDDRIEYKSRNEKAIKCIKNKYYKEEYERKGTFANKLMNILQGEDKDNN